MLLAGDAHHISVVAISMALLLRERSSSSGKIKFHGTTMISSVI
jgi:hypothetical protein